MARELAVWFQRSFGNNRKFEPGPFRPPSEPKKAEAPLHAEMQRLSSPRAEGARSASSDVSPRMRHGVERNDDVTELSPREP
jgi:hypothetical protein